MKITYSLNSNDTDKFAEEIFQKKSGVERLLIKGLLYSLVYVPIFIVCSNFIGSIDNQTVQFGELWPSLFIALPLFLIRFWIVPYFNQKSYKRSGLEGKIQTVELLPELIVASSDGFEMKIKWAEFKGLTCSADHAVLWTADQNGLFIPYRAFGSDAEGEEFRAFIAARVKRQD